MKVIDDARIVQAAFDDVHEDLSGCHPWAG
jgi:hypothetical protein